QAFRHSRLPSEGIGGLSRTRARARRKRHEVCARSAALRGSGARYVQGVRRPARSGRRPAEKLRAERRQRLVARDAVRPHPPPVLIPGWGVHDAWLDLDGELWFTCNIANRRTTIGKIDSKTGEVKLFKVPAVNGLAAQTHGMTRDPNGIIWFNVNNGRGGLGRLDPQSERIHVYMPPQGMSPTGGATTVDYDGKGRIWSSAPDGALRFDPATETFTEFKSITYKTPNGTGVTYGAAGDRDGNGWWAEMTLDIIGKGDSATGKPQEVKLASVQEEMDRVSADAR